MTSEEKIKIIEEINDETINKSYAQETRLSRILRYIELWEKKTEKTEKKEDILLMKDSDIDGTN